MKRAEAYVLIAILLAAFVVACGTDVKPVADKNDLSKVKGLEDCKVWSGYIDGMRTVLVRCPNSSTATMHQQGKAIHATVVIEGRG